MAITIDPRPTYFGDRMIVTGTYAASDTTIDLSSILASIDAVTLTATAVIDDFTTSPGPPPVTAKIPDSARIDGTSITIVSGIDGTGAQKAGKFLAIGRRS